MANTITQDYSIAISDGYKWDVLFGQDSYTISLLKDPKKSTSMNLGFQYRLPGGQGDALDPTVVTNFGLGRFNELANIILGLSKEILTLEPSISDIVIRAERARWTIEDTKNLLDIKNFLEIETSYHQEVKRKKDKQYQRFLLYKRFIEKTLANESTLDIDFSTVNREITIHRKTQ